MNRYTINLDPEEQEISDAIDKAIDTRCLHSAKNVKEELSVARKASVNYLRKSVNLNHRKKS